MWDKRNARVVLVGKPEEKDHLKKFQAQMEE
jgi:hypothetical protein